LPTHIWWIRRDLRLIDNPALQAALETCSQLLPVFIRDPRLLAPTAPTRRAFLFNGLRALDADLRARGSRLIVRSGEPLEALTRLTRDSGAQAIYALEDYSPYARARDARVAARLPLKLSVGTTVHHPELVHKADGSPYTVFTPFSKAWKALPLSSPTHHLPGNLPAAPQVTSEELPEVDSPAAFPPGESEALRRLEEFLATRGDAYAEGRDRLDLDGTSTLSPYLRFGMLSPRLAVQRARQSAEQAQNHSARRGFESWINELIWREFYHSVLYEFPYVLKTAFNPRLREIRWREAPEDLLAWKQGRTGYPVVDAGMRQMLATGWMHNRGRMIAASFLTKDLLINWQEGERWFIHCLVDGDPAANNGGWQWTAGVGTDAAPYFRIFNPTLQGQKFDPQGKFVRRWVPELESVPDGFIHTPWMMPLEMQTRLGVYIGLDYPVPIVDHRAARERTLAAYRAGR
jgi:deoxyribodipyrimidine photo-lyase